MIQKDMPKELRLKIRRYLEYVWESKKTVRIEEAEVFSLLNDNLKEKITVCMNGMVIQTIPFFEKFDMEFISELTFYSRTETYATDDTIFVVSHSLFNIGSHLGR